MIGKMWRRVVVGVCGAVVAAVGAAAQDQTVARDQYAEQVQRLAETELLSWIQDPVIIEAIREQNLRHQGMSDEEIAALDTAWIAELSTGHKPMIWDLLDRLHSILLRDRREASEGVVTEIIVMDRFGLNAAISDPTSDFYQGDEAKYQETYLIGPDSVHVGDYEFDESTQKWQVQVSMPVLDPETSEAIGAVTFGIDLSQLE